MRIIIRKIFHAGYHHASDFKSRVSVHVAVYHSSDLIGYYQEGVKKFPRKLFPKRNFNKKGLTLKAYMGDKGHE